MQLCTIRAAAGTRAVVVDGARGMADVAGLIGGTYPDAGSVIRAGISGGQLADALSGSPDERFESADDALYLAPIQQPGMIWGIGLNYREHAADLAEQAPAEEPASFVKGPHTVVGPDDPIPIPWQSERTTAEAELGLVFGRTARNVTIDDALESIWGVMPILDQTAEDILQRNPRYLTRSKNFPGFLSCGPGIVPIEVVTSRFGDIDEVVVQTVINGAVHRENQVRNMMFPPRQLIAFHSAVFAFQPGDIISTGTPGAVHVRPGDVAECHIAGIGRLRNPVVAGEPAAGSPRAGSA